MLKKLLLIISFIAFLAGQAFSSCMAPQNAIEAENCNPGSNNWIVNSIDSTIQGFATDISYNVGQSVNFKINTSASNYQITIFRMGYYQGSGARQIATVTPSAKLPQSQPACLTDSATGLVDCGNWAVSASWTIPSNAVSGIYFADIVRGDTGGANQIFFIVRDDSSHSDVLFQTSDESWEAYNGYGGHSFYGPTTGFDLTNRGYKVSYNRPFAWIENQTQPLYAEYPMVRWLEQNGYNVSYFTSVDAARSGALIQNHKLYLSVGHDEYVSGPKRTSVEAARDAGVNLAFFSGNEFFWKTRWENSIDGTGTPYRTLVCYKETLGATSNPPATTAVDPQDPPTWTGTWRDSVKSPPADGGRPENALTGQLFRVNGPGNDNTNLSIKVPSAMGKFRFWRNTPNVATQAAGATWTLPGGTLGYEWDAEEDNGARPAGLFDLSSATYNLTTDYLQDAGGLYGTGTATHKLSLYRAPSGALVFGAGTVQWSFGLDSSSGGTADVNMQQATVNLFADMGVQPATLQAGLHPATQSTDTTPPVSTITAPANGTSVQAGTTIAVTGTASDVGGLVAGVEISVDNGATWHPVTGTTSWSYTWVANTGGTFTLLSRAVDDSANLETPSGGPSVNIVGVASVTANPSTLSGGASSQGTVTLSAPAGTGGTSVTLTSSVPSVAAIPGSVVVPAGSTTATFPITTVPVGVSTSVVISAKFASTATTTLTVNAVFPPAPGVVDIDAVVSAHQGTSSSTITSGAFSTAAPNELVLALISSDALQQNITVSGITGGGLSWTMVQRANGQNGTAEVWRALAPSVLTKVTATATFSQSSPSADITIMTFAGVDTSGTNGSGAIGNSASASAASGAPTASLTTTRNNSWVIGVGADNANAIARTVGPNQVLIDSYLSPLGDTFWSQRQSALVSSSGSTVTINDTAPTGDSYNLAIVEVRPPLVGQFSISGNLSANGAGATVTLSGAMSQTTTADAAGNYSFVSLVSGSYTVTPSKAGFAFSPASQSATITSSNISNLNFTASQAVSISGTISPASAGSGATITLSGAASGTVTADASGNYSFNTTGNGTYTITPSKNGFDFTPSSRTVTVAGANISGVNFTAQAVITTSLAIDVKTSKDGTTASSSISSSAFSTSSPNELLLAFISTDYLGGANTAVSDVAGGGLTWSLVARANTESGDAEVWRAFTPAPLTNTTVTATLSRSVVSSITIITFTGVDLTGTNGSGAIGATASKGATNGAPSLSVVTTRNNSWVFGVGNDFDNAIARTPSSGQTVVHQDLTSAGDTYWVQMQNATTPLSGTTVAISDTAPTSDRWNLAVVEVLPSLGPYSISGTLTPALSGVTIALSGSVNATAIPDGSGNYTFSGLPNGSYTVTPSKAGFNFSPASQNVIVNGASVTAINFTATAQTFSISGTVSAIGANATVALGGSGTASTTADASGNYSFTGLSNGTYTVTPSKSGVVFNPTSQNATVNGSNVSGLNFTAAQTFSISGNLSTTGANASVALSGSGTASTTADASGNYSFTGLLNGTYTVTPSKSGVTFNPTSQNATVNGSNVSGLNFTAAQTFGISGNLSATGANATVALSGSATGSTTADASGNYTFTGLLNGTYTVTPSKSGVIFNPTSQNATVNGSNVSGVNFTATGQTFSISGNLSATGANATVALSGSATSSTTADASGNYTFTGLTNGTYTITPSKSGVIFNPTSQNATVNGSNVSGVNFTATAQTFSISGNLSTTGANASVALTGSATASTTADASGNYTFTGLSNGTYTLTPSKSGATFSPTSQNATVNGSNVSGVNFTAVSLIAGLAIDANSSKDGTTASTTIATPAFSTVSGNELLLAFIATDYLSGANTTVSSISGGGLTWNLVKRTNVQSGDAEIWAAFAPSALTNVTVTATVSQKVVCSITVTSFTGVDTTIGTTLPNAVGATGTANARTGAPSAALVTTRNNSWVFGVGNDYDNAVARSAGTGQTVVHQFLTPTGDTYWVQMQNATTPLSGTSVSINDVAPTGDRYNLTTVEIRTP